MANNPDLGTVASNDILYNSWASEGRRASDGQGRWRKCGVWFIIVVVILFIIIVVVVIVVVIVVVVVVIIRMVLYEPSQLSKPSSSTWSKLDSSSFWPKLSLLA